MTSTPFYNNITSQYGHHNTKLLKEYATSNRKIAKAIPQRTFLLRCRQHRIIPLFIQHMTSQCDTLFESNLSLKGKLSRTINKFHEKLLNLCISEKCSVIDCLDADLEFLKVNIKGKMPQVADLFLSRQSVFKTNLKNDHRARCLSKFNRLRESYLKKLNFTTKPNDDWFCNLTEKTIPDDVCWLLSLGKKFSLPLNDDEIPVFNVIADAEFLLQSTESDTERDKKRLLVSNVINKAVHSKQSKSPIDKEILHINKKTKSFLKHNPDLIVLNADKGNKTVFMLRSEYLRKMDEHFSDNSVYKQLSYDTTYILENRLLTLAKNLLNRRYITDETYKKITKHNSSISKAYGLPKIHKVDVSDKDYCGQLRFTSTRNIGVHCGDLKETHSQQQIQHKELVGIGQ